MNKSLKVIIIATAIIFLFTETFALPAFAQTTSAQTAIASAKDTLKNCYLAVKDAENAGANVDPLMSTLNDAAGLLTKAQLAYASNDNKGAYNFASQSKSKLNNFITQATTLKETAINGNKEKTLMIVVSLVAAVAIACAGVSAVVVMNRRERKRPQ